MNYWLWLEDRQQRVRAATAVGDHPRPRSPRRLPRLLAVRTVPPGRPDATQSLPLPEVCSGVTASH